MSDSDKKVSRRSFLGSMAKAGAAAAAAPLVVPRRVLGGVGYTAPSDTVNVAGVGVGGMGASNLRNLEDFTNIVALADVDWDYASDTFARYPDAEKYWDFRKMLDEQGDNIDGVVVATPDHTHALVALTAMEMGKHVYVQKPLTWSVAESRALREAAERTGVVTQMGNQGHSSDDARLVNEYVRDGRIGDVRTVHVWTNRPIWPQGVERPDLVHRVPQTLTWELFLGPAPEVPYHPVYHPFKWRGWVDYGVGALGDMGAHLIDHPYWALELGAPETIETRSTPYNGESHPNATMTYYNFPAREDMPPVEMIWYDGGLMPPRPRQLPEEATMNAGGGVIFEGEEGILMHDTYGGNPRLYPEALEEDYPRPPQLFERVEDEHHEKNWVQAIQGQAEATSDFRYAAPLTETMLLGIVSMKAGNRRIHWDDENMRVTNIPEANQYLSREPRDPWRLETARELGWY